MVKSIKILENSVARKIAAGEVIDRPASAVRELLDNAIDSGASDIAVYIETGGINLIRVTDNGCGMGPDDLELCTLPHATSKIENAEDLYHIETLGFRGEALSSIAASSRLEITSCISDEGHGHCITADSSGKKELFPVKSRKGTTVTVKDLFYSLPARKQFLKTPSAETSLCTTVFLEKAAVKPEISFRLFIDNNMKFLLNASDMKQRIASCYPSVVKETKMINEAVHNDNNYSIRFYIVHPELFRKDRKYIHIYLNGRRIQEYSLMQAAIYGYSAVMPAGHFPAAFILIDNNPELVDFNIHPAKKEARIKNISQIHHSISDNTAKALAGLNLINTKPQSIPENIRDLFNYSSSIDDSHDSHDSPASLYSQYSQKSQYLSYTPVYINERSDYGFKYYGQLFGLFLMCEKNSSLYLIDQHAAHERIIYEKMIKTGTSQIQKLLVPWYFDNLQELNQTQIKGYKDAGIIIEKDESGSCFIDSLPEALLDIKKDLHTIFEQFKGNTGQLVKELYSAAACRKAVKAGEHLDIETAYRIISETFLLEMPYCPHGRPLWEEITKKQLLEKINRIL